MKNILKSKSAILFVVVSVAAVIAQSPILRTVKVDVPTASSWTGQNTMVH